LVFEPSNDLLKLLVKSTFLRVFFRCLFLVGSLLGQSREHTLDWNLLEHVGEAVPRLVLDAVASESHADLLTVHCVEDALLT
jgi:hypothetical protein